MNAKDRKRFEKRLVALRKEILTLGTEAIAPNRKDPTAKADDDAQALNEEDKANKIGFAKSEFVPGAWRRSAVRPESGQDAPSDCGETTFSVAPSVFLADAWCS